MSFAGFGGMHGSGFGGLGGNPFLSAGYSPGFIGGMGGFGMPGMYPGWRGPYGGIGIPGLGGLGLGAGLGLYGGRNGRNAWNGHGNAWARSWSLYGLGMGECLEWVWECLG